MSAPNRSLQEKSAARMVAAQMLYAVTLNKEALSAAKMLQHYDDHFKEEKASLAHLKKLLEGMEQHGEQLEPSLDKILTGDWKKERMSPLLLAILRLGIFELAHFPHTAPNIIVNEYVTLTGQFFGADETGFINAALNAAAIELRAA